MRRPVARGRMLPQALSTDPRYGRLSLKAQVLYPLLWVNADDQGRLSGDPDEIKYAACPSIREIEAEEIPALLQQMETRGMIKVYPTSKTKAIQMLDWWEVQRLQWAYPSGYQPPEGWQDRLRYHASPTQIVIKNWPPKANSNSNSLPSALPSSLGKEQQSELAEEIRVELMSLPDFKSYLVEHEMVREALANLGEKKGYLPKQEVTTALGRVDLCWEDNRGEFILACEVDAYLPKKKSLAKLKALACSHSFVILRSNPEPFQWEQDILLIGLGRARGKKSKSGRHPLPSPENKKENEGGRRRGRGRGNLPSALGKESPSPATSPQEILKRLFHCHETGWGSLPGAKISAQLRDLSEELSAAGCPLDSIDEAFKEAAHLNKYSVSYVRAILLDWLGVPRGPP